MARYKDLQGKKIGLATAKQLSEVGAAVALLDINESKGKEAEM